MGIDIPRIKNFRRLLATVALACLALARALPAAPPSLKGFDDSSKHWYSFQRGFIRPEPWQKKDRYQPAQYREIAENILVFQNVNGGWPKDYDMCAKLTPAQREKALASRHGKDTSFDNHNVHSQIIYLAQVFTLTKDKRYAESCLRGLDYIFKSQLSSGGWPSWWPGGGNGFRTHITYNDGVTMGCLEILRDAANATNGFEWLDAKNRERARTAVQKGIRCLLDTQYVTKSGVLTAWGQQHYPGSLKPAPARDFELACLTPQDSAHIVEFLMGIEKPTEQIMRSIVAAAEWIRKTRLTDYKLVKVEVDAEKFFKEKTAKKSDLRVERVPGSEPIWAREYDMEKHVPIFAGTDRVPKYDFNEIDRGTRNRTPWFGNYGGRLLRDLYPAWLKKNPAAQKYADEYRYRGK